MKPLNVPVAFLDTSYSRDWGIHVTSDDATGCHLAIKHLVELGHRRIGFIGGRPGRGMAEVRENAYRASMKKFRLEVPDEVVIPGNWTPRGGERAAAEMLRLEHRPTALLCANDAMAMGAQRAGRRMGLQMPGDLSIIGFANLSIATLGDPELTTVAQPAEEMGQIAARLLLSKLKPELGGTGNVEDPVEALLPTHLVVRESTAPPAGGS
jgi:LacI family transcriptional regulator